MTTQPMMLAGGAVSIGNERPEDQDPTPDDDELENQDTLVNIKRPERAPAPAMEPTKDAPSFPPGSPETVPPGPTSG